MFLKYTMTAAEVAPGIVKVSATAANVRSVDSLMNESGAVSMLSFKLRRI